MSDLITREREKYTDIWSSVSSYGDRSPGEQLVTIFDDMRGDSGPVTILDAGCGSGKGALALAARGHRVTLCDTTDAGLTDAAKALPFVQVNLWHDLSPLAYLAGVDRFDYVYCCDVLEHIPTPFTMLVIARLLAVAERGAFLSISTVPDNFGAWVGGALHLTVQPFVMWRDQIATLGRVRAARDLLLNGVYLVEPR